MMQVIKYNVPFQAKYAHYNVDIYTTTYSTNGRTAIMLIDTETEEEIVCATVNLADYSDLSENEVLIKDYSENEGVLSFLEAQGIVSKPIANIATGFVSVQKCKLLAI